MLKDALYKILISNHRDNTIKATIEINKNSEIFAGHFPGQPVLPGACMLQIVKQVLADILTIPLRLKKADHLKFLKVLDPETNPILQLTISYSLDESNTFNVTADLTAQKVICFKFKGSFIAG